MKTYSAMLTLYCVPGANIRNVVPKPDLTVPEIMLLRQDPTKTGGHGIDCLSKIKSGPDAKMPDPEAQEGDKPKMLPRSDEFERARLQMLYGEARVLELFGEYEPLPTKLQNFVQQQVDQPDDDGLDALTA